MKRTVAGPALLQLIERCLREGSSIQIDGLGSFELDSCDRVVFEPTGRPRVFLAYAEEDYAEVKALNRALREAGIEPWMDREQLLPGQNWPRAIERGIEMSDFFVGCFSPRSANKHGHFQCELRYALDVAKRVPLEEIFLLPVRLQRCEVPRGIAKEIQYVDLFPDWDSGVQKLVTVIRREVAHRHRRLKLAS